MCVRGAEVRVLGYGAQSLNGREYIHPATNLMKVIYQAGYEVAAYERNAYNGCCMEYTFVHTGVPPMT
jgi:hypothetical protein